MQDDDQDLPITPDILLRAYAAGIFPMAESAEDPGLHWIEPQKRGILPLDRFHVGSRLMRLVRQARYRVVVDRDFAAVIEACAAPRQEEGATWINRPIRRLYGALFEQGFCHTVEVYDGEALVGGLYGIALGSAFFGESMFHRARDCSKIALVHLVARLRAGGFTLLDTQFVTSHLQQFGATEIPRKAYRALLDAALDRQGDFHVWPAEGPGHIGTVLAALGRAKPPAP
ncbi:leucyl/phenylalanyl-tRNA--protein transferase [Rhabdaerophilum sp. SD176]|uniref:leucyl/phenylalanyl-tRNA--protein transferase n=1 Tax=Rhabdaerophilum sp. SD176 TaxID=2983548 RepID=UPI0024DF68A0|nr:leucyl/phenylalanyl-tRNA--protein transferase [Rhabdaerophilum sp. SD176]